MTAAGVSKRAGRKKNEDYIGRAECEGISCYVVADGLGGYESGEIASQTAVKAVLKCFENHPALSKEALKFYLDYAQSALLSRKESDARCKDMATTIVVLLVSKTKAVWGHLGDTRLYRFCKKELYEITDDHSVAFINYKMGDIDYSEIRNSPDQNKLLKILGDSERYAPDISAVIELKKNTKFLLCTDGFWKYVTEAEVENTARKSKTAREWLDRMEAILRGRLTQNSDNYSAITIC